MAAENSKAETTFSAEDAILEVSHIASEVGCAVFRDHGFFKNTTNS
jgi:hypothetical protein